MKDWNSVLLESIIRDNLFEQASSESARVTIRPMLYAGGAKAMVRAKDAMRAKGIEFGKGEGQSKVSYGFEVINRQSAPVSESDVVKAIKDSDKYGIKGDYNTENWVYLISDNRAIGKNSSKRDVLILRRENYSLQNQLNTISTPYNAVLKQMKLDAQNKYAIKPLPTTAENTGMKTNIYFSDDIPVGKDYLKQLKTDQRTMELSLQASQSETWPVNRKSPERDILMLRSAIIAMMNNNPIFETMEDEKTKNAVKSFKNNGSKSVWDNNMTQIVELISTLFNKLDIMDTPYKTYVDETFYLKIEKYQTEEIQY